MGWSVGYTVLPQDDLPEEDHSLGGDFSTLPEAIRTLHEYLVERLEAGNGDMLSKTVINDICGMMDDPSIMEDPDMWEDLDFYTESYIFWITEY